MSITFIYPGQFTSLGKPGIIKTILGSCVGVAFWDKSTGVGGLCHYLLPESQGSEHQSGRYGDYAIRSLFQQCLDLGARAESTCAQIFGGGAVVDSLSASHMAIGDRNIECARKILKELGVPVIKESVGGTKGRRIALDTATGEVHEEINGAEPSKGSDTPMNRTGSQVLTPLEKTKVLIVDDSATIRSILKSVFDRSKKVDVVGTAVDPYDAREKIVSLKPDVLTLDIEMPKMNGIAFLEKLMAHHPLPVVVVSSLSAQGSAAERALELGAIEFVHKPSQFDPMILSELAELLIPKVIAAASINVKDGKTKKPPKTKDSSTLSSGKKASVISLVTIGGNGGAAEALPSIVRSLAPDTPPVVVSLSTISGFAQAWVDKLKASKNLPVSVEVVSQPTFLKSGTVYIAGDHHLKVTQESGRLKVTPLPGAPSSGQRPSSDILFRSASDACKDSLIGVLLSGYGQDGVEGAKIIRDRGGWMLCQDPEDCAFNYTVIEALENGLIDQASSRDHIAAKILEIRSRSVS